MWWKVLLAIVVLWLAFGFIMWLVKGLITFILLALVVVGTVALVKWFVSSNKSQTRV